MITTSNWRKNGRKREREREREREGERETKGKEMEKKHAATSKTDDLDPETVPVVLVGWTKARDRGAESVEERE